MFLKNLFFLQIHKLSMIFQASGNPVSIHIHHTDKYTQSDAPHTHTLKQCGSGRVCCHGSLLLQWCSGATLQPHTAPNVPELLLASRSHMGTEQPIEWEEHFVWIESLSALRTKEERKREMQWWKGLGEDFLSLFPITRVFPLRGVFSQTLLSENKNVFL